MINEDPAENEEGRPTSDGKPDPNTLDRHSESICRFENDKPARVRVPRQRSVSVAAEPVARTEWQRQQFMTVGRHRRRVSAALDVIGDVARKRAFIADETDYYRVTGMDLGLPERRALALTGAVMETSPAGRE